MSNYKQRLKVNPLSIKGLKGKRDAEMFPLYNQYTKNVRDGVAQSSTVIEEWYWKLRGSDAELIDAMQNVPII